jgi:hypothetical protein
MKVAKQDILNRTAAMRNVQIVLAGFFVLVLAFVVVLWTVVPISLALAGTDYQTLVGEDKYHTSVLLSQAGFSPGVDAVVVADGDDYRIAVCSASLAGAYGGPVLLTPSDSLDWRVGKEIERLDPDRIILVGVGSRVAGTVSSEFGYLAASGRIVMISGADVYETAALVAEQVKARIGAVEGVVVLPGAEGPAFAGYAVSVSPLVAAKCWPMLFVSPEEGVPTATADALAGLGPDVVVEVGTSTDVPGDTRTVRFDVTNGYETSTKIAEYAASVGLGYSHVVVTSSYDTQSSLGLAVGAYLAPDKGLVIVTASEQVPAETVELLGARADEIGRVDFCGPTEQVRQQVELLLDSKGIPSGFGVVRLLQGSTGDAVTWVQQRLAELSYRPGPVDGVFDDRTLHAVIAFQKWEGLRRDGVVGAEVWWRLLAAKRPVPRVFDHGAWIEIDKTRQVLLYCVNNVVDRTLDVSTGNPSIDGGTYTPSGVFHVTRENTYERVRYKPLYIKPRGVMAIHGYGNVPTIPYSHGCIRMTRANMDEFHDLIPVGTAVYIY